MCTKPASRSTSAHCSPHSSPRRAPVTAASHRYKARRSSSWSLAAAMTAATVAGVGEVGERCGALGSLAEPAGFRSIHSQRTAAVNAPDRIAWIWRIVIPDIGRHWCGWHPARRIVARVIGPRARHRCRARPAGDDGAPALAGRDHSLRSQLFERAPQCRERQAVLSGQLAHRWQLLTGRHPARGDGLPDRGSGWPPRGTRAAGLDHYAREGPVLGERPAGARQVAASAQPRIERVQDRPSDLAELHRAERGQDRPRM